MLEEFEFLNVEHLLDLLTKFDKEDSVELFINIIFEKYNQNLLQESLKLSQELYHLSWTKLHTGYWKNVKDKWRELFSYSILISTFLNLKNFEFENLKNLMKEIDLGLMMGNGLFEFELQTAMKIFHKMAVDHFGISETKTIQHFKKRKIEDSKNLENSILRLTNPTMKEFKKYFNEGIPIIIENSMDEWPALNKWKDLNYFKNVCGFRTVPVEFGKSYTSQDWTQKLLMVSDFIDTYLFGNEKAYLAQHQLFEQIVELKKDILEPIYLISGNGKLESVNSWFGPRETVSPLHIDQSDSFFNISDLIICFVRLLGQNIFVCIIQMKLRNCILKVVYFQIQVKLQRLTMSMKRGFLYLVLQNMLNVF
jgi:[protein]-arginine 3-hydroxylase / protease